MFEINEVKEMDFKKATADMREAFEYYFPGIEACKIPFFWDSLGSTILINTESIFYLITKEIIKHITGCSNLMDQMNNDIDFIKCDYKGENLYALLSLIKLLYSLEEMRRVYVKNRIEKARVC